MAKAVSIDTVEASDVSRYITGIEDLDWQFGRSCFGKQWFYGLPLGRLSLVAGEGGVGKSRWALALTVQVVTQAPSNKDDTKVLWFQNEVNSGEFKGWLQGKQIPINSVYVCEASDLDTQISEILRVRPKLVIVDSIQMLDEYCGGHATGVKKIIDAYRSVVRKIPVHACFLGQYTSDKKIKGGTSLPHAVDTTLTATYGPYDTQMTLTVMKNRCNGPSGLISTWQHTETGIWCNSVMRAGDPQWVELHPQEYQSILRKIQKEQEELQVQSGSSPSGIFQVGKFLREALKIILPGG